MKRGHLNLRQTWYILDGLPVVLPAAITGFGAVGTLLLLLGQLRNVYVWPLGLLAAIVLSALVIRSYQAVKYKDRERTICNVLVLCGVVLWGALNMLFSAQHIITNRDPGTYANAGIWLIHHTNLHLTLPTVFGKVAGVDSHSGGFSDYTVHGHIQIYAQGLHLLPIFLGLAGRIIGVKYMFHVNVLFGMTALLAIYAVGRLLVRPLWAMIATGALAASMPFLYFSRDTYTEPLAATLIFGALALLFLALKTKKPSLWLVVGLVTGAGTLTRIDGFLTIAAMLLFLVIVLAIAKTRERAVVVRNAVAMVIGMVCTGMLGWLDLLLLSRPYYLGTETQFMGEIALIGIIIVGGVIVISLSWRTKFLKRLDVATRNWRAMAAASSVIGLTIILASRPFWTVGKTEVQATATQWVGWYIGPFLALLGLGGMALVAARVVSQKKQLLLLATFLVVLVTSLVYITAPNIAPDQIWAARRLVPVILPGVAIFGAIAIDWIDQRYGKELEVRWRYVFMVFVSASVLVGPLVTSRPELLDRDTDLLQPMLNVCQALPVHSAVLWLEEARTYLIEPTDTICGRPATGYGALFSNTTGVPSTAVLAQIARNVRAHGDVPIVGIYGSDVAGNLTATRRKGMTTVTSFNYQSLTNPIDAPPTTLQANLNTVELGIIQPNGTIAALPSVKSCRCVAGS